MATALMAQIVGSTIFHWTYFHQIYYGNFTLKKEIQFRKKFLIVKIFAEKTMVTMKI